MKNEFKLLIIFIVTAIFSAILIYLGFTPTFDTTTEEIKPTPAAEKQTLGEQAEASAVGEIDRREVIKVTKIIDGDTIEVEMNGQIFKVRYIGVNTPETVDPRKGVECFGKEASSANKDLVLDKEVILEKDVSETDRYGRLLRLVYLPQADGSKIFVNDYLVREGFAYASTFPPDVRFAEQFKEAEKMAREKSLGLWGKCTRQ